MKNDIDDEFQIFVENNIKELKEIIKLPNDNYTCTECYLIPEILNVDYSSGEIEFNCRIHGIKKISLKEYLLKMSKKLIFIKSVLFVKIFKINALISFSIIVYFVKKLYVKIAKKSIHIHKF